MTAVAIIGAGPAGSSAAISLARSGVCGPGEIVLIESKAFPRAKVCGEFLSPAVTGLLESMVGMPGLMKAGARRCERFVLELGKQERGLRLAAAGWALGRGTLDELLRDHAARAGVRIVQPVRVERVTYSAGGVCLSIAGGGSIEAAMVVHADGWGRHDPAGTTPARRGVVGMKCHFTPGAPVRGVRIRSAPGAYVGTIQVEGGLGTCAMVVASELPARFKGDADELLGELGVGDIASTRTGPWLACGVADSGYIAPGHARSFRIGNAAAAVEPVGGEGIGLALWSGATLAGLIAGCGMSGPGLRAAHVRFASAYRRRLFVRRPSCRLAAAALVRPGIVRACWPLLGAPSLTLGPWSRLTGKPARPAPITP